MLELVNISNAGCDIGNLLQNKTNVLSDMIREYGLDGIEFMLCAPWDRTMYPPAYIKGVHLLFWPSWLDFWRGDKAALLAEFGTEENIRAYYGSLDVDDWVERESAPSGSLPAAVSRLSCRAQCDIGDVYARVRSYR